MTDKRRPGGASTRERVYASEGPCVNLREAQVTMRTMTTRLAHLLGANPWPAAARTVTALANGFCLA